MDVERMRIVHQIQWLYTDDDVSPYHDHQVRLSGSDVVLTLASGEEYVIEVRKVEGF